MNNTITTSDEKVADRLFKLLRKIQDEQVDVPDEDATVKDFCFDILCIMYRRGSSAAQTRKYRAHLANKYATVDRHKLLEVIRDDAYQNLNRALRACNLISNLHLVKPLTLFPKYEFFEEDTGNDSNTN